MVPADPVSETSPPPPLIEGEWDDPVLWEEDPEAGRLVLPPKREAAPTDAAPIRNRSRVEMGLQIGVKLRAGRNGAPDDEPAPTGELEVIKLECPSADLPFQANLTIAPPVEAPAEPPRTLGKPSEESPDWGGKTRHSLRWLVGSGLGVAALLVLALVTQERWLKEQPEDSPQMIGLVDEDPLEEIEGFEIDGTSEVQSRALLATIAKARQVEEILPLIRQPEVIAAKVRLDWQAWNTPPDWEVPTEAVWHTGHEKGRGFGILVGTTPDFKAFRAYFVREQGVLKLDWEATRGLGDASFEMLERGSGLGGTVRAYVKTDSFFTAVYPETDYRSFKLVAPDREAVVWGYAKRGGQADEAISALFSTGMLLEGEKSELPMTLRLGPPPAGSQKNQWLILEMLHNEWVSP